MALASVRLARGAGFSNMALEMSRRDLPCFLTKNISPS